MNATSTGNVVIMHPPEAVVKTSMLVVLGGFFLLFAVIILATFSWAAHGERDGKPDIFGKRITVREVAERYKAAWSPGKFWPRDAFEHTKKTTEGSPLFKVVWTFLTGWYVCMSFFLIVVGVAPTIEIFREEAQLRAASCAAAALCLCAIWPILFRVGSEKQGVASSADDEDEKIVTAPVSLPTRSKAKGVFLWVSFALLLIAALFAVAASAMLQAWTLPGPQYGTLLFLGPGYGLFAGWLLFAAALNLTVAISYASYPSGTLPWPETRTQYTHRGSLWPPMVSLVIAGIAVLCLDPAMPLPMFVGIFLFTPRQKSHLAASFVCVLGIGVAAVLVVLRRGE